MDIRICKTSPGGTVNVQGEDFGRTFGNGAEVDFDEHVKPNGPTWGAVIGAAYAHLFISPEQTATANVRRRQTAITSQEETE